MTKLLYIGTAADKAYLPYLKPCVSGASVEVALKDMSLTHVELLCKSKGISGVFTNNVELLKKLLDWTNNRKDPSLDSYAGSIFKHNGIEYLIINPLSHLVSVSYGTFIFKRHISKLACPSDWLPSTPFNWAILDGSNVESIFARYTSAFAIACDIETFSSPLAIRCIGYTAIFLDPVKGITTHSCVLPLTSEWALAWMRKFNWELKAPKIFQNGKYDNAYLSMFNAVPYNWLWDTAHLFHSWYSELPKDLAFLNSFFVRDAMYWKDLAETSDLEEYYRYNALDTHATAHVWIAQMLQMPEWARQNYLMEFPLVFPCHLSEMTGMKRDMAALEAGRNKLAAEIEQDEKQLETMTSTPGFNSNSYKQVRNLLKCLTGTEHTESDEKYLKKMALKHPLNSRLCNKILDIRGKRKLKSTYLRTDADITKENPKGHKEHHGRILYSINPHGTDTGRCASKEHHFWCGLQIQNIPTVDKDGGATKSTVIADEGFRFAEVDLEQAETRDTAYAAGEDRLIAAVESPKDFHSVNASAFFGIPYDAIYDDVRHKKLDVKLRDLAKRVNHGANYLMGWSVLIDTMGEDKIWTAKKLLKLPSNFTLRMVAEHLLAQFHKTYPKLSAVYYKKVCSDVMTYKMLTGPQGWTRYCFGNPVKNKQDLNSYVAHVAQSMNAMTLNKAYMRIFYEIAMHPSYRMHFKLCAQIHDSILFQFREGHEYLCNMVKERMEIPVTVKGADGVTRTFTVPAAIKAGKDGKGALRWSETE